MKKFFLLFLLFLPQIALAQNAQTPVVGDEKPEVRVADGVVLPEEMNFTDRFIVTELRDLRIDLERMRAEFNKEIQEREIHAVDRALSYSANTVNFFFVLLTIVIAAGGLVGWKTLGDIKKSTKASMEKETMKIIDDFQKKIQELEKEQKINIFWRQFNTSESDKEKLDILNKIQNITPRSMYAKLEKTSVYLSMELYEKVVENASDIINSEVSKYRAHALYNRASAYNQMGEIEKALIDLNHLIKISPDYKETLIESEYFTNLKRNAKFRALF